MSDELALFRGAEEVEGATHTQTQLDVLVVEQGDVVLGILATCVVAVVPWQTPAPLPRSSEHVLGVVQDRGRLVAVHRYGTMAEHPKRLVVCTASPGLIGIAATATRHVGTITLDGEPQLGVPIHTSAGALTLIAPEEIAQIMTGNTGKANTSA